MTIRQLLYGWLTLSAATLLVVILVSAAIAGSYLLGYTFFQGVQTLNAPLSQKDTVTSASSGVSTKQLPLNSATVTVVTQPESGQLVQ